MEIIKVVTSVALNKCTLSPLRFSNIHFESPFSSMQFHHLKPTCRINNNVKYFDVLCYITFQTGYQILRLRLTIIRPVTFFTVQKSIDRSNTTATKTPMNDEENIPPNKYINNAAVRNATWQRLIPGFRKALPDCTAPNSEPKSIMFCQTV